MRYPQHPDSFLDLDLKFNQLYDEYPNLCTPHNYYLRMKFLDVCNNILYPVNNYMQAIAYNKFFEEFKQPLIASASLVATTSSCCLVIQKIIRETDNDYNVGSYCAGMTFKPIDKLVVMMQQQEDRIKKDVRRKGKEILNTYAIRFSNFFIEYYLNSDLNIKDPYIKMLAITCIKRNIYGF